MKLLNAEAAGKERSDLHEMLSGGLEEDCHGISDRRSVGGLRYLEKRNQRRSSASQIASPHLVKRGCPGGGVLVRPKMVGG